MARLRLLFRVPSSGAPSCSSASSFREQRIILNAIRFMANDLRIPLVCLGTDEANKALMTDPQCRFPLFQASRQRGVRQVVVIGKRAVLTLVVRRPLKLRICS